jgi:hypothetical protein
MQFCDGSKKGTASNFVQSWKKCNKDPGNNYTSIRGREHELPMERSKLPETEKGRSMLIIFFDMKGNVNKEFIMAAPSKFRTLL